MTEVSSVPSTFVLVVNVLKFLKLLFAALARSASQDPLSLAYLMLDSKMKDKLVQLA